MFSCSRLVSFCILPGRDLMPLQYKISSFLREARSPIHSGSAGMLGQSDKYKCSREVRCRMLSCKSLSSVHLVMTNSRREMRSPDHFGSSG
uniref:Uncharacterized protein n=1 Tax=Arundo donax TaxID=35708 RepID=A0A0A8YH26_ARUDO